MKGGGDVEAQNGQLYPNQMDTPQLRWSFIRKIYSIICFQLALTSAVSIVVVSVKDIPRFFRTLPGLGTLVAILILTIVSKCFMSITFFMHDDLNLQRYMCQFS